MTNAIIIAIGDELLIGQVTDTNSGWIAQRLNLLGISVLERIAIGDDSGHIKKTLEASLKKSDIVIITGGLGPTKDDLTKDVLNEYFGSKLTVNEEVKKDVSDFFERAKRPMLDTNLRQAEVPDIARVLRNRRGTAPGMWFDVNDKVIVALPGVPHEMKGLMEEHVLPELKLRYHQGIIIHKTIMTCGIGESFLAKKIEDWENDLPKHIKLAYLPNLQQVRLRLTATGNDENKLKEEVETLTRQVLPVIKDYVFGLDDIVLEEVIGVMLKEKEAFLSTAESCTGGYIAHKLTSVQGASEWFKGSMITYATEIKTERLGVPKRIVEKHGVVSEQVVKHMAKKVAKKFDTQYAISISGWADPRFHEDDDPPGLVWIGWYDGKKATAKSFQFFRDRMQNIEMATTMALDGLRRIIEKSDKAER